MVGHVWGLRNGLTEMVFDIIGFIQWCFDRESMHGFFDCCYVLIVFLVPQLPYQKKVNLFGFSLF